MEEKTEQTDAASVFGQAFGRMCGFFISQLIFAYPVMVLIRDTFSPAAIQFLFGGMLTFWKTYMFLIIVRWFF